MGLKSKIYKYVHNCVIYFNQNLNFMDKGELKISEINLVKQRGEGVNKFKM